MNILRYEENDIEFFTIQATGESGMSQSGLARLCGVSRQAVNQLVNSVSTSSCPEFLKPLQNRSLTLSSSYDEFKNAQVLKDFVCARILEWYAFESQRPTKEAQQAFRKFATLGIRTWIQSITGWDAGGFLFQIPMTETPSPLSNDLQATLAALKQDLTIALKHRHAIHNIVEQPTVVDISLQQIIHTAVHVQGKTLKRAIKRLEELHAAPGEQPALVPTEWRSQLAELQAENELLRQRFQEQHPNRPLDLILDPEKLQARIETVTEYLLQQQKRPNGDRAQKVCRTRATIFVRYQAGESLKAIAQRLKLPYETAKSYLKLVRRSYADQN
ncbi:hypothetical protein [Picosynechococcus sp. NKBG15041c]|uniref:hypothetical protein n=1 Tax=Picosynechococcus sp. NKBG15041c TaxID=1407650 RepID=UPI0003FB2F4C|nr:hypothetical protein [Picosynechococcus sp. NKBG15041c]